MISLFNLFLIEHLYFIKKMKINIEIKDKINEIIFIINNI